MTPTTRGGGRPPALAALLSFLWPGLGQFYEGKRRLGALFCIPAVLVVLLIAYSLGLGIPFILLIAYNLRQGIAPLAARLAVDSAFAQPAILLIVLTGVLRVAAVLHAYLTGEPSRIRHRFQIAAAAALIVVIVVTHAAAGYGLWFSHNALDPVFSPQQNPDLIDQATPAPSLSFGVTPAPPTPTQAPATAVPIDSRVTILLTGVDSAPTRGEHLYDSIMVISYDPKTNSVQMVSVPRDSASFPLYYGGVVTVNVRINSLPTYVRNGWVSSPDAPFTTLVKEVGYLVGIPINYYAVMDLGGFVKMIDMVGGIDVDNPSVIDDATYDWLGAKKGYGFALAPGPQHLDGINALAYVRSRHGSNNSDWARASRQQEVMVSLLHKMSSPSQLLSLPNLISTLGASVSTTFPANLTVTGLSGSGSAATTCLLNYKVAELSIQLFGKDSLWYGKPAPANTCPV